jgi:hypothetical protein
MRNVLYAVLSFTSVAIIAVGCDPRVLRGGTAVLATDGGPAERPPAGSRADATEAVASIEGGPADSGGDAGGPSQPDAAADAGAMAGDAHSVAGDALPGDAADARTSDSQGVSYQAESGVPFGSVITIACSSCSNGERVKLGADSGFTLNNVDAGTSGTHVLSIFYTNGDSIARSIYVGVSGNESQGFLGVFPPTGDWTTVSSVSLTISGFRAGTNNTVEFFIDSEHGAPDLDRIVMMSSSTSVSPVDHCSRPTWLATASITAGDGSGPIGAIDGNLETRWANNRHQDGTDWFQVDFGGSVKLTNITLNTQIYPGDYPGTFEVFGSADGIIFSATPFATGTGTVGSTVINFSQQTVWAIKINQTGSSRSSNWWQIAELQTTCSM